VRPAHRYGRSYARFSVYPWGSALFSELLRLNQRPGKALIAILLEFMQIDIGSIGKIAQQFFQYYQYQ
jgi:hypothetical protein